MTMNITNIVATEILDSRGNPTIETTVTLCNKVTGTASVPSGASAGSHEALELRDGNPSRYGGKGVLNAVNNVNTTIKNALMGADASMQRHIDSTMLSLDGTPDKSMLGANAILSVSLACAKAASNYLDMPLYRYIGGTFASTLPLPMMNILNGGAHAANNIDIQEFMIVPTGAKSFSEGLMMCVHINSNLRKILVSKGLSAAVGDEGGVAPDLANEEEALMLICEAIEKSGYTPGSDVKLAIDAAASEWYKYGIYVKPKSGARYCREELINYWDTLCAKYPIISLEDPAAEDDWDTWSSLYKKLSGRVQVVGDDLFVTNSTRLKAGIERKSCNAILIKPNQVGTLTETADTVALAKSAGFGTIISHRSGETEDTFIADLTVGLCAGQIKTGAPCRGERTAKYNRLLKIEKNM